MNNTKLEPELVVNLIMVSVQVNQIKQVSAQLPIFYNYQMHTKISYWWYKLYHIISYNITDIDLIECNHCLTWNIDNSKFVVILFQYYWYKITNLRLVVDQKFQHHCLNSNQLNMIKIQVLTDWLASMYLAINTEETQIYGSRLSY